MPSPEAPDSHPALATATDDAALIRRMARGDRDGLAQLYDRYAGVLLAVGERILRSRREAEDLVHDVFLEAWHKAAEFDPGRGSVRTWLLVRTRSRALDRCRSASMTRMSEQNSDEVLEQKVLAPEEDPALQPDRAAVRRALLSLPKEQRTVLLLGYFEGLSSSEIAARANVPLGTVKSRVATALAKLRSGLCPADPVGESQ